MKLPDKPVNWMEIFDNDAERSTLFSKIQKKEVMDLIIDFNKRYLYWSDLEYRTNGDDRKYIWTFMKFLRRDKYLSVPFNKLKLKYTLLPEFSRKLNKFDKYLAGNIGIQTKSLGLQKSYLVSSLMEEAIASSAIEGASTTRKVAKAMLREKRKPKNRSEQMIANNYDTIQFVLSQRNKPLTKDLLLEIQKRITRDTLDNSNDEGKLRDSNDIVVGHNTEPEIIAYMPPNHKDIPSLIDELCQYANAEEDDFIHPILKGIILHFLIGYIHPFNDGNGRTARSVFYWYVLSKGYWLFEYMAVSRRIVRSRKDYDLAYLYTEYDELDLTYFIDYILRCIEDSLTELMGYIERKQIEQKKTNELIRNDPRLNLRQAFILEEFMKTPNKVFTIAEISRTYKTVYQTARTDLMSLEKLGYLKKQLSGKEFLFSYKEEA